MTNRLKSPNSSFYKHKNKMLALSMKVDNLSSKNKNLQRNRIEVPSSIDISVLIGKEKMILM